MTLSAVCLSCALFYLDYPGAIGSLIYLGEDDDGGILGIDFDYLTGLNARLIGYFFLLFSTETETELEWFDEAY